MSNHAVKFWHLLDHYMTWSKKYVTIGGLILTLLVIRAGEYLVDYVIGDKDGHFSSPLLSSGTALSYSVILIAVIILVTLCVHKLLFSQYSIVIERLPGFSDTTFRIVIFLLSMAIYAIQSYALLWVAGRILAFKPGWLYWTAVVLSAIAFSVLLPGYGLEPHHKRQVMKFVAMLYISALLTYGTAFVINAFLYKYGHHLPFLNQARRYHYWSLGIFDRASNPRYRKQFYGFVPPPHRLVGSGVGDTFEIYGLPLHSFKVSWPESDSLGWPNTNSIHESQVLFIGDSFGRAYGAGFDNSIPTRFEEHTGMKTYNASNEGYGFPQYLEILRYLMQGVPDSASRFQGKLVYILLYVGNDLGLDLIRFRERVAEEKRSSKISSKIAFYLKLGSIRRLFSFARNISASSVKKKKEMHQLVTPDDIPGIEKEKQRTQGWYPHFVGLPSYEGMPFAFFRGNLIEFRDISWLDEQEDYILEVLRAIYGLSQERGIRVRFVVLPSKLQIAAPYLNPIPSNDELEFHRLFSTILKNEHYVHEFIVRQIQIAGFEVLDMYPIFEREIVSQPLLWPGDLHYTPEGYQLVVESIISVFHQSGSTYAHDFVISRFKDGK